MSIAIASNVLHGLFISMESVPAPAVKKQNFKRGKCNCDSFSVKLYFQPSNQQNGDIKVVFSILAPKAKLLKYLWLYKNIDTKRISYGSFCILLICMGSYRSTPDLQKFVAAKAGKGLSYAVASMCGWRQYMEDGHISQSPINDSSKNSVFGVFDGHSGPEVAVFSERNFVKALEANANYQRGQYQKALKETFLEMDNLMLSKEGRREIIQIKREMRAAGRMRKFYSSCFLDQLKKKMTEAGREKQFSYSIDPQRKAELEEELGYEQELRAWKSFDPEKEIEQKELARKGYFKDPQRSKKYWKSRPQAGCAANVVLVTPQWIYCANAGDCRTAASVAGKCVELSHDHKPLDPKERERILKAGSFLDDGRIDGNVNLSRGFGDFKWKNYHMTRQCDLRKNPINSPEDFAFTANPDIIAIKNKNVDFIVMGCDGIWEKKTHQELVKWVQDQLKREISNQAILEQLLDQTVAPQSSNRYGKDNMSAILIRPDSIKQEK